MAEQDAQWAAASETERALTANLAEARVQVESFLQKLGPYEIFVLHCGSSKFRVPQNRGMHKIAECWDRAECS